MAGEILCDEPADPEHYGMHLRLMHCVYVLPSTPIAELYECHAEFTRAPAPGHVPHTHRPHQDPPTIEHGFW
jgi:hypothetical protein